MISRIKPFLNKLIPQNLALKGLSKIDPKFKKFIFDASAHGYTADQALNFLREQSGLEIDENQRPDKAANERQLEQQKSVPRALTGLAKLGLGATGAGIAANLGLEALQGMEGDKMQEQPKTQNPLQELYQYDPSLAQFIEEKIEQGNSPEEAASIAFMHPDFIKKIKSVENKSKENFIDMILRIFNFQKNQKQSNQGIDPQLAEILQQGSAILQKFRGGNG